VIALKNTIGDFYQSGDWWLLLAAASASAQCCSSCCPRDPTIERVASPGNTRNIRPANILHLQLHDDDVIEALHDPRHAPRGNATSSCEEQDPANSLLATHREDACEMTHHVDADGQVTVKLFTSVAHAMSGFRRSKKSWRTLFGCQYVQGDLELRVKRLAAWRSDVKRRQPIRRHEYWRYTPCCKFQARLMTLAAVKRA
jgi:hypothetical protein